VPRDGGGGPIRRGVRRGVVRQQDGRVPRARALRCRLPRARRLPPLARQGQPLRLQVVSILPPRTLFHFFNVSIIIIHTYHSCFITEGVAEASQTFLKDAHVLPNLLSYEEYCTQVSPSPSNRNLSQV
jgi:hypothetical protein